MKEKGKKRKKRLLKLICLAAVVLGILGFGLYFFLNDSDVGVFAPGNNSEVAGENNPENTDSASESDAVPELYEKNNMTDEEYVDKVLSEMTLDEKIYQMLFVTPESITGVGQVVQAGDGTKKALEKYPVGGIIYFAQNIKSREQITEMIKKSQSFSKIPLFIGVDEEGGRVSRLSVAGVRKQPPMKEIGETGDPENAYEVGVQLATDLSELGFNVNFAPVADVLVEEANTVIGDRAFGTDAGLVSEMVAQEVKGLQENGVSSALKHFPGHGSTITDSHNGYSASMRTMEELRQCEFLPFKAGVDVGVDFIMTSHITTVNATKEAVPATLSKELISDCLIEELGFEGIVITDSFQMGAITANYPNGHAALKAVEAGVDIILMPTDVKIVHDVLKKAVDDGLLTEERIDVSVRKILLTKVRRGIMGS